MPVLKKGQKASRDEHSSLTLRSSGPRLTHVRNPTAARCGRLCGLFLLVSLMHAHGQRSSAARQLIESRIDDAHLVMLAGNVRSAAQHALNDRGAVRDDLRLDHLLLLLRRSPEREQALAELLEEQTAPGSPQYHRWLTPQQFGLAFGAAVEDIQSLRGWLAAQGFQVNEVSTSRLVIDFSGTAGQVRTAFHTELHALSVDGAPHIANISNPQIPLALAPAVAGIVSLHDFRPRAMHRSLAPHHIDPGSGRISTDYTSSGGYSYQTVVPEDLATIYSLTPLFSSGISGQGQTIAVVEDTNLFATTDWTTFRSRFGLSKYTSGTLMQVHPGSSCGNPGVTRGDDG